MFRVAFLMFRSFLVVCWFNSTPLSLVPCFCNTGSADFEASGRSLTGCAFVGSVCTLSVVTGRLTSCTFPVSVLKAGEAVTGLSWGRVALLSLIRPSFCQPVLLPVPFEAPYACQRYSVCAVGACRHAGSVWFPVPAQCHA